nr:DNA helicase [Tanacetum cinerariifolium]
MRRSHEASPGKGPIRVQSFWPNLSFDWKFVSFRRICNSIFAILHMTDNEGRCHGPRTLTLGQIFALIKSYLATSQQTAKRSKVCKDEDVDAYVSAELPDPIVDPKGLRFVSGFMIYRPCGLEWAAALKEVAFTKIAGELCAQILIFYDVSDPVSLWKSHWKTTSDDIPRRLSELLRIPKIHLRGPELEAGVLYELEVASTGYGKSVQDYEVPLPPPRLLDILKNKTFMEKKNYDRE